MGTSLDGHFLVAMPSLGDSNFGRTVVLILRHSDADGAFGLVVNRALDVRLGDLLDGVPGGAGRTARVRLGGPVNPSSLWLLHRDPALAEGCREVVPGVFWGADHGVLERVLTAAGDDPGGDVFRCYVGYAGWSPKQLEGEITAGSWVVLPATAGDVFAGADGEELWSRLVAPADFPFPLPPGVFTRFHLN